MTRGLLLRSWRTAGYLGVSLAVMGFTLLARGAPWRGEWAWTFDWVAGSSILSGPLFAGMAAYETAHDRPFDRGVAGPTAARKAVAALAPLTGPAAAVLSAYAGAIVVAGGVSWGQRPTDRMNPTMLLLGGLVLAVFGLAGTAVGQVLAPIPAALCAWLGGLAVTLGSAAVGVPHLFRIGAATGSLAGLGLRPSVVVAYCLVYLLAVAVLYAVVRRVWLSRRGRYASVAL
ncbi:hypothetical protein [Pedococcus sp. 5OH_020]|uniref:hypothetical protein n=1 Tax=Pedococcus sp. 5OH_020 TaxID=2989814 RepID=UPI0022EA0C1E|nr:hypothetical protein [Pedococcus sp. 5OH_020]